MNSCGIRPTYKVGSGAIVVRLPRLDGLQCVRSGSNGRQNYQNVFNVPRDTQLDLWG
jgi:hypothetical protein